MEIVGNEVVNRCGEYEKMKEVIEKLRSNERFDVEIEEKKTVTSIVVKIKYDRIKLLKRSYSIYLRDAYKIDEEIEKRAVIYSKKIKNTMKNYAEVAKELEEILQNSSKIISEFDAYLTEQQRKIVEILKICREENSRVYRRMREEVKKEREAIANGDFENVSDRRIKEFLRDELGLKNIVVIDKNSKHRAILAAEVTYYKYDGLRVKRLLLCGLDDNQESWCIEVARYCNEIKISTLENMMLTVEDAMAMVFCVPKKCIEEGKRQGDILVVRVDSNDEEIIKSFGKLAGLAEELRLTYNEYLYYEKTVDEFETNEFNIQPNHKLSCEKMTIKKVRYTLKGREVVGYDEDRRSIIYDRRIMSQVIYIVETKNTAEIIHPSHRKITLEPGKYVIVTYPSFYKSD